MGLGCLMVFDGSMVLMVFGGLGMFNGGCWRVISGGRLAGGVG